MRVALALLVGLFSCGAPRGQEEGRIPTSVQPPAPPRAPGAVDPEAAGDDADGESETAPVTHALITDPAILSALEAGGLSLGERLEGPGARGEANDALARRPRYGALVAALDADIRAIGAADPKLGVGVAGNPRRLFDRTWLVAATARYELVGVAARPDRRPFHRRACGETRLIFRLSYATEVEGHPVASRLPMTILLEYAADDETPERGCAEASARWQVPADREGEAIAAALLGPEGPLAPARLAPARLTQILINVQTVRWPSAVRPDLGGHAEYLMRAFQPSTEGIRSVPLENTPDVARLRRDKALREELLAWLRQPETLDRIDAGTAILPERFLSQRAVSVSPRGLARRANRPFRQLFDPGAVADLELSGRRTIGSPEALLRRLDDATCAGCHQGRAVAGFHLLGEDPIETVSVNALAIAGSPHLMAEVPRRVQHLAALARGGTPAIARAPSERGPGEPGTWGARCGLGDPGFAAWTCTPGLACRRLESPDDDAAVGVCLPETGAEIGDPCEVGRVRPHADPHRDRIVGAQTSTCGERAACNTNRVGFPGGMCTGSCGDLPGEATCGAIAVLVGFNNCLARRGPFDVCLAENVTPAGLRACGPDAPCRDDYICARTQSGAGACIPPYFLFQLRVDGHPAAVPTRRR